MKRVYYKIVAIFVILILITNVSPATPDYESNEKSILIRNQSNSFRETLFDSYIRLIMRFCYLPSLSACVIRDDEVIWAKGYGYSDPDIKKESTGDTIYLVMSISKPVAATALMQLIENESYNVDLDDDVNDYLPFNLRNPNYPDEPITIRMLLAHQSSLAPDERDPMLEYLMKTVCLGDPDISSYPHPWLENYLVPGGDMYTPYVWLNESPGTNYHYANIGYGLIEYLIELISGQDFNDYCKENIFIPLNMMNTSFLYADLNISDIAVPYTAKQKRIIPVLKRQPLYSFLWAACANLKTTVMDLSHFVIAHKNGGVWNGVRILNESTVDLMHSVQYQNNDGQLYGLGFMIDEKAFGKKTYGHDGGGPGVHTRMWISPSDNTSFIYFTTTWTWRLSVIMPLLKFSLFNKAKYVVFLS